MIQRIQSIYMFLAIVLAALLFYFPYAHTLGENAHPLMATNHSILLPITGFLIGINFIALFLFKKRKLQMLFNWISILMSLGLAGIMLYEYFLGDDYNIRAMQLGQFIPGIIILLNLLAIKRIKKDDKLVRSMDRLR